MFNRQRKQLDMAVWYKEVFTSEAGQKVLSHLIERNRVLSSTFNQDARMHAFQEGKREAILSILTMLQVDFKAAEKLLEDAKEQDNKYQ